MKHLLLIAIATISMFSCNKNQNDGFKVSSSVNNAESVYLTHDNRGNPVVVWTEKNDNELDLFFAISVDDGKTFSKKASLPLDQTVAAHAEGMPKIAFKRDGTIIIAYEKKSPTKENKYAGAICYITSRDDGKSWSPEKFMHSDTIFGRSRSYFDIEALPDGEVGASWLDIKLDSETGGRSVLFAKTDERNSFTSERLIDSSACQCCRVDLYTDVNDNVYIAYRGLRKGAMGKSIRDMKVSTSVDKGETFMYPLAISVDNWNIDGCPHTGPSLCSNKAGLFTLWYTEGNGNGIYYTHKSAVEDEFLPRELVSAAGRHPQVSANGDKIAMIWEENIEERDKQMTTVNYQLLKDGVAIRRGMATPKDANAFSPVVTQTKKGFLVAYLMEVENKIDVYLTEL